MLSMICGLGDADAYKDMAWFMAKKARHSGVIRMLADQKSADFVIQFQQNDRYDLGLWKSKTRAVAYYKLVSGVYEEVK